MPTFHRDEYATSTDRVRDLRRQKDALYQQGMPRDACQQLVKAFFRPASYEQLRGKDNHFMVAPSTTGRNPLPYLLAKRLQQEYGGQVVTGWALPLEKRKASAKGGLGKMEHPARFAAADSQLSQIPKSANLVLVDDVVTTGETTDALREVLAQRGLKADAVVSLGQSELRKVSQRDIDRLTHKLGEPSLRPQVEGVLRGRLKHKANYIERTIHDDTRESIRRYFQTEFRRLQGLGAVRANGAGSLRSGVAGDRRLQFPWRARTGDPGAAAHQVSPGAGLEAGGRGGPSDFLVRARSLESLRAEVGRGDVSLARATRKALRVLGSRKMAKPDARDTVRETSLFLAGNPRRSAQELVMQAEARLDRVRAENRLGMPPTKEGDTIRELNRLREEVKGGLDIQSAASRGVSLLGAEGFSRADRMRAAHELGAFLKGEREAPDARQLVLRGMKRELAGKLDVSPSPSKNHIRRI